MNRINLKSGSAFEETIGFARAVKTSGRIFISGTAPIAPDGSTAFPGDLYNQTRTCLEIMKKAVEDAGGKWQDVVRTRIYLKNIEHWKEAARAHREFMQDIYPACTFLEVKGFIDPQWLVETEADCTASTPL